jgi:tRNA(Glu) U13 pseudouridine synthase TruD
MHEKQQKELLIKRILKYLPDAPDDAAQRLLQETVADLEHMLAAQSEKHAKQEAAERVSQHAAQMRRESQLEGAFVHACRTLINNRYLCSLLSELAENSARTYPE